MENQRNLLLAVVLCGLLILGWDAGMNYFYPQPDKPAQTAPVANGTALGPATATPVAGAADIGGAAPAARPVDLARSLVAAERVKIAAPRLAGSINPVGARIDDVTLTDYRETVNDGSGPVRLFAPEGTDAQHFAEFGFLIDGMRATGLNTVWQASGGPLAPGKPVTLSHTTAGGHALSIRFNIDENYLLSVEQTVANTGEGGAVVQPFALVNRTSRNASPSQWIAHSGPIGGFADTVNYDYNYDDVEETGRATGEGQVDWIGFTDIYWLSALVPQEGAQTTGEFRSLGNSLFRADVIYQPVTVAAGQSATRTTRLYAGAKESVVLDAYQDSGISQFGLAISWGWFRWFEKPMLALLRILNDFAGNFGVAIILLTLIVRGLMFPIAQKQFASMAGMKAVQPKMKAIQERYKDDKQKQQQEIMALYKKEGVNPLAGCLPLLIQIPIFFALYKVLILAIEMRHEKFLYIADLSSPDPAKILNLFGLLPFDPPGFLGIGILAVLLGVTMWLTFKMNPTAMDPIQQQIFNIMPWILMFVMAPFAAGLLIYWVTSNVLTLAQQSYLYSRHPQLKAQAEKDKADQDRAKPRDA
ncbi:membrane protein insertase YidC [Altererythrobacter sp. H2]|uniref:membrane protein insertase YidC n=1 Tax=Altererythrobacter sp. H2 TaxID=3108391 RepID=UPI002B4BF683|nr:membrane protein insertase YidC [Altererythrobacter sp. H2]WRK95686.1 membrane protein insertase YidC [Altererythrobacter sp. H2]